MLRMFAIALFSIAFLSAPALADSLSATQTVERMVTTTEDDGTVKVSFVEATTVIPGETLVYWLNYDNEADVAAENVVLTVPVPADVTYVEKSASAAPVAAMFSVDGGQTFSSRGELTVSAGGVERTALAEEITHIRWSFAEPIPAGESGQLGFQAVLN